MDAKYDVNVLDFIVTHIYDINSIISDTPVYNWNELSGPLSVDDIHKSACSLVTSVRLLGLLASSIELIKKADELGNDK